MASGQEGKDLAQKGKDLAPNGNAPMTADYGRRAAAALDLLIPGPHRDKAIARLFGTSVRMAKYLRSGRHWTAERLSQASRALGAGFDVALYSPAPSAQHDAEMAEIAARLARMEACFVEMARGGDPGPAPTQGPAVVGPRHTDRGGRTRVDSNRQPTVGRGLAPPGQGHDLAGAVRAPRRAMTG